MSEDVRELMLDRQVAAAILSAGKGTRMRGLSSQLPKPLLPLCGPPLIAWSLAALEELSIKRVGVNSHHLSERLRQALAHHQLSWSNEEVLQGTGGGARGIWRALELEGPPIDSLLILNGDAWFDFSLTPLLTAHLADPEREATLCLRETSYDDPFGRVGLNEADEVVRIAEVEGPRAHEEVKVGAFLGAQVINSALIQATPDGPCDLFRSAYRARLERGARVGAYLTPTPHLWADVGTPERYLALHQTLLERHVSGSLNERVSQLLPPLQLRRSPAGGLIALMEGASCADDALIESFAWLYPGAKVHAGCAAHSLVMWPEQSYTAERSSAAQKGVWCAEGFVDASGSTEAGAVGAAR